MSLADELVPDKRYNKVEAALEELPERDREAWLNALDSGDYKLKGLAEKLTEHTSQHVTPKQVSHYREKVRL